MKLTVTQLMDAMIALTNIIRDESRQIPQRGKYRLARLHTALSPEYTVAEGRKNAMIRAYNCPVLIRDFDNLAEDKMIPGPDYMVPKEKEAEFFKAWAEVGNEVLDLYIDPIPLAYLSMGDNVNGGILAKELSALGDLVVE